MEINIIQDCKVEPERLSVVAECMETYEMEKRDPENEWVWNIISRQTVIYSCGAICRKGEILKHNHNSTEIELCQRLSQQAANLMAGELIEMGDEGDHEFSPFYMVANVGDDIPEYINEEKIRSLFGQTIYPDSNISIKPLEVGLKWWLDNLSQLRRPRFEYVLIQFLINLSLDCLVGLLSAYLIKRDYLDSLQIRNKLESWSRLISWFKDREELHGVVFISINTDYIKEEKKGINFYNGACVLPRLLVGLTKAGSLVGIFSCVVYT